MDETHVYQTNQNFPVVAAALSGGDDTALRGLCAGHRRELHVYTYRILGSLDYAESPLEKALERALRRQDAPVGATVSPASGQTAATFRTWLYRLAAQECEEFRGPDNVDLDELPPEPAPVAGAPPFAAIDICWPQPYPDRLLDQVPLASPSEDWLVATAFRREGMELPFVVALQHLPTRQREALILRDVYGWPAHRCAEVLRTTDSSAKSLLHRARRGVRQRLPQSRSPAARAMRPTELEQEVLARLVAATERGDQSALRELVRVDAVLRLPRYPDGLPGREPLLRWWEWRHPAGEIRLVTTAANRQPAVATYLRPSGADSSQADYLHVLRIDGGRVAEVASFLPSPRLLEAFDLPTTR